MIAVAALRFLYKVTLKKTWSVEAVIPAPKKPQTLPVVLSPDEVVQFLDCVDGPQASRDPDDLLRRRPAHLGSRPAHARRPSTASGWSSASSKARARRIAT